MSYVMLKSVSYSSESTSLEFRVSFNLILDMVILMDVDFFKS